MIWLAFVARHGRWVLPAGLVIGTALPPLARAMEPAIVPLLAFLLFLAALRIGPGAARPRPRELPRALMWTALLQVVPPLIAIAVLGGLGWLAHPAALGVVLVLAASPITGSPGLAILSGADPAPALRQLVLGTALLPLTALPVFAFLPVFAAPGEVVAATLRLLAVIGVAGAAAFLLRARWPALGTGRGAVAIDGLTALAMGLVVIALTSALGPALVSGDPALWPVLALVFVLNFGTQLGTLALTRAQGAGPRAPALAIVAGNRNLALFLAALPEPTAQAILLFVGCYQVPMFLTPLLLAPLYRRLSDSS